MKYDKTRSAFTRNPYNYHLVDLLIKHEGGYLPRTTAVRVALTEALKKRGVKFPTYEEFVKG